MENKSIHEQIYNSLRSKIFSGVLKPGDLLPSESQLCKEFSASRETVRKGLKNLEGEHLIFSRPKIGYFVSIPNHEDILISFSEADEKTSSQYRDINGIYPDEKLKIILQLEEGQKVIELAQIIRNKDNDPIAYEVKYVPYERAYPSVESELRYAVLPDLTLSKIASFDYYTDVRISAIAADTELSVALECDINEPLLLLEQLYLRQDGKPISYSMRYSKAPFNSLRGTSGVRK